MFYNVSLEFYMRFQKLGKKIFSIVMIAILGSSWVLYAEYRAYLLEIYDIVDKVTWEIHTGMTPDMYFYSHGGQARIRMLKKATWMCYGDTSDFDYVCDLPTPRFPKFDQNESVKIGLKKHVTHGWIGKIEVALWREDLRSNVYGIRFDTPDRLYAVYFERDLDKTELQQSPLISDRPTQ